MSDTPETKQPTQKRGRFQFRLSTLVVLTLVAGMLLWLNLTAQKIGGTRCFGWPWTAVEIDYDAPYDSVFQMLYLSKWGVLRNLSVCLLLIVAIGYAYECLVTRWVDEE